MSAWRRMSAWRCVHIDFAQPQRALRRLQVAFVLGALALMVATSGLVSTLRQFNALRTSEPTSDAPALAPAEPSAAEQAARRWLANDLAILQRSIERTLPAGVVVLSVSASQESAEVTLTVQSASAEKILAMPAWLQSNETDASLHHWKVEQLNSRAGQSNVFTGVLSCSRCWTAASR